MDETRTKSRGWATPTRDDMCGYHDDIGKEMPHTPGSSPRAGVRDDAMFFSTSFRPPSRNLPFFVLQYAQGPKVLSAA